MHSSTIFKALASAMLASVFASEAVAKVDPVGHGTVLAHRRHHARRTTNRRRGTCTSKGSKGSSSGSSSSSGGNSTTTTSGGDDTGSSSGNSTVGGSSPSTSGNGTSSGSGGFGFTSNLLQNNEVYIGFLPDGGDAGGKLQTMASINSAIGAKSAAYGWYAQAHSGSQFTGGQLLQVMDDIKACNCIFQPAVMPTGGWKGLTADDNSQAKNIANVMKKFTDEGIEVWLRFAHEMNYYQSDGTYEGSAEDFKEGWTQVAKAVREIAPDVKMWWTPNVANADSYAKYAPDDFSTVDLVGIDYYPKSLSDGNFVKTMKDFHDTYASGKGKKFAIGETGLGYGGSVTDRMSWLKQIVDSRSELPEFIAVSWFNYFKGYDFQIVGGSSTSAFTSFIKSG